MRDIPLSGLKIVIDPGHGLYYKDGDWLYQRPYCWGLVEDELTIEIASYLCRYLRDHTGAEVFCTRELNKNAGNGISGQPRWKEGAWCHLRDVMGYSGSGSSSQDLTIRPEYANSVNADIFISIHTNAGGGSARGTMTLWGGLDAGTGGGSPPNDRALADDIHPPVVAECGTQDRGVWKDQDMSGISLCVLRETNMPACLVEVAFHDNYDDNVLLHEEWFKEAAGRGLFFGIFDHYGLPRPNTELPDVVHELSQVTFSDHEECHPHLAELYNGHQVIVWERHMEDGTEILFSRTSNRGMDWRDETVLVSYENEFVTTPTFAETKDGSWFLAYVRERSGMRRICYRRSSDGGDSWTAEQELTSALPGSDLTSPCVYRTEYGTLWFVFTAEGNDNGVYFCYSTDNGESFNPPTLISDGTSIVGEVYNSQSSDNKLWALWSQFVEGEGRWSIFGTSSFSWDGWQQPIRLTGGSNYDAREPALGENKGELYLFYSSDRTNDSVNNHDVFFVRSADGGESWNGESLLTPNVDEDASPATLECSDGRLWVVFSSRNGTGGNKKIYLTNNVTDIGNRPPVAILKTENNSNFGTLLPSLEFQLLDHDGDDCTGEIFWQESGEPGNASSATLTFTNNYTFSIPLKDAAWYDWWIEVSDGESTGICDPETSSFYVDINNPPTVALYEPVNNTVFPWDVGNVLLMFRTGDGDHDALDVEVLFSSGKYSLPGDMEVIYQGKEFPTTSYVPVPRTLGPGEIYYWQVIVVDENDTETKSPIFTFSLADTPENLAPVTTPLSNHTVSVGEDFRISSENCTDPEGRELQFLWWLFNTTSVSDPYNASFEFLKKHCGYTTFPSRSINITFGEQGTYLLQLNISDPGAYTRPPAIIFLRSLVIAKYRTGKDPVRGEIIAPDIVGAKVMVKCCSNLTWGNDTPINYTWILTLGDTSTSLYTKDLNYSFPKAGDYNITLSVLTSNNDCYLFYKEITAIPWEAWEAAWSITVLPGYTMGEGNIFHLSLKVPSFIVGLPRVEWYYGSMDGSGQMTMGATDLKWDFMPPSPGKYIVRALIRPGGMEYTRELHLTVTGEDGGETGDDDASHPGKVRSSGERNPFAIVFVFIFLSAACVWAYLLKDRIKKGDNKPPKARSTGRKDLEKKLIPE